MPSRARQGNHATKPAGSAVSMPPSQNGANPSSGNEVSRRIIRSAEVLISSAARGAQNARHPQRNANAITVAHDATRLTSASASQPGETASAIREDDQTINPTPATTVVDAENGVKPSVSRVTQIGRGWIKVWSS